MKSRSLKIFIFAVVFGVPVVWYLFLQVFGENQFELEVLDSMDLPCIKAETAIYFRETALDPDERNQLERLEEYARKKGVATYFDVSNCLADQKLMPILLVDKNRNLRGTYKLTMEEVDRAIVETDLLLTLTDGTNTDKQY